MWGQGLTVDCSMDFVNLSSFFEALNAKLLSVAEEIHPSVASGKFIPTETYILEIHPFCETSDWVASIPDLFRPLPRVIVSEFSLRRFPGVCHGKKVAFQQTQWTFTQFSNFSFITFSSSLCVFSLKENTNMYIILADLLGKNEDSRNNGRSSYIWTQLLTLFCI